MQKYAPPSQGGAHGQASVGQAGGRILCKISIDHASSPAYHVKIINWVLYCFENDLACA